MLRLCGYRLWWQERRQHADTKAAYDNLVIAHHRALAELASPCESCVRFADERDAALLQLDAEQATRVWVESMWRG